MTAVSAPQADEIEKAKMELLRVRFDVGLRESPQRERFTSKTKIMKWVTNRAGTTNVGMYQAEPR
ncbi:MAG: hypothetical protein HYS36_15370 [Candidatus Rokubacteria bacterium]|nr:hypothetical protein [Candidatus Rokubacteria bacterium]